MTLGKLVSIAEDGPWCGTRPPGRPKPPHVGAGPHPEPWAISQLISSVSRFGAKAGPTPEPWIIGHIESGLYAAISLHQIGQRVGGAEAERITRAAGQLFDEVCGSIPISQLIWIILHRPPPPPPPWLQQITFVAEIAQLTHGIPQGDALSGAARKQLSKSLEGLASEASARTTG